MKKSSARILLGLVVLVLAGGVSVNGWARGFCSAPVEPYCVMGDSSAGGDGKKNLLGTDCQLPLARYLKALGTYRQCLQEQLAEVSTVLRERRLRLDCDHHPALCEGVPEP